jgi:hypothetical protein
VLSLGDYGVNADTLAEIQTALTNFRNLTPQPKTALLSGKTVTEGLATLFWETNQLVGKSIDGKLLQYQKKAPEFYTAYTNARAVGREVRKTKKVIAPVQPVAVESVF